MQFYYVMGMRLIKPYTRFIRFAFDHEIERLKITWDDESFDGWYSKESCSDISCLLKPEFDWLEENNIPKKLKLASYWSLHSLCKHAIIIIEIPDEYAILFKLAVYRL